ncbi:MAG: aconitate hydratase [Gammaproteobacteria bacterium]|jgi:aconitate hydratase|nr:aconitate hydratase [Gammaproteobacteria bacterium]
MAAWGAYLYNYKGNTMPEQKVNTLRTLTVGANTYHYRSLQAAEEAGLGQFHKLPISLKILLENLLRFPQDPNSDKGIHAMATWLEKRHSEQEIAYRPARVLMQDFTGVPAIVDLAAMRDALHTLGGKATKINPLIPVDLVIDHSVQVDSYAQALSFLHNVDEEMKRNIERYTFLKWGQKAFENFRVVPPGTGICHQVNLEYLGKVVWTRTVDGQTWAYPDTLVGTDSHTTMINGLGILGWGVGGIEAEAAMLGQAISMLIPEVVGVRLTGRLREGIIATDLVLTITEILRRHGVVSKFVEFFGEGLQHLPLADRATIANMAPEYGATCGFFPVDKETLAYMTLSGRDPETIALTEAYTKAQGMWHDANSPEPVYTEVIELDLSTIEPSMAGPKRPQDRVGISNLEAAFKHNYPKADYDTQKEVLQNGAVVIAAITSCTNTSNPSALIAAGLLAKKALARGLKQKPWVKTSLAPGSKVVTDYLEKSGLQTPLNDLGFNLVGYGCTTCIGNSGPLEAHIEERIQQQDLVVSAVLSGNRNFEGRIHPLVQASWLASPPLVVAMALAGTVCIDLNKDPLGHDGEGKAVYLKDIWPSQKEIAEVATAVVTKQLFHKEYADVFTGDEHWKKLPTPDSQVYAWDKHSTYIQNPPYFVDLSLVDKPYSGNIEHARILAVFGDNITTDHISPAGSIKADSPAGLYLKEHGIAVKDFNSYGARRGNHEVMMRGTFANIRIKNEMLSDVVGGYTLHYPSQKQFSMYDAAMKYRAEKTPLVIIAGKEYGTGSSRDWAAKGPLLLGVKAVIVESFERIHRSNLVGMGILPLEFMPGTTRKTLNITGDEIIHIDIPDQLTPKMAITAHLQRANGETLDFKTVCRIDTDNEIQYYRHGGILQYVLTQLAK